MNLWSIVPVKPSDEAKSRLASVLDPEERAALSRQMLNSVLRVAQKTGLFTGIVVISRDRDLLETLAGTGVVPQLEAGVGLNRALQQAASHAQEEGAEAVLVLPSDLPLLAEEDIDRLHGLALADPCVVIAPSHDGGSNALLLRPPDAIAFSFGPNSFHRHCQLAVRRGLPLHVVRSSTLALDVDRPADLHNWLGQLGQRQAVNGSP
jgi:2-phospho-L-lactate guanylyltransferase